MKSCSKHIVPEYLQDLKKVSEDIADMPYDKVVEFLQHLEKKINKDAQIRIMKEVIIDYLFYWECLV